MPPALKR
jgi:uncharacterized protein